MAWDSASGKVLASRVPLAAGSKARAASFAQQVESGVAVRMALLYMLTRREA